MRIENDGQKLKTRRIYVLIMYSESWEVKLVKVLLHKVKYNLRVWKTSPLLIYKRVTSRKIFMCILLKGTFVKIKFEQIKLNFKRIQQGVYYFLRFLFWVISFAKCLRLLFCGFQRKFVYFYEYYSKMFNVWWV